MLMKEKEEQLSFKINLRMILKYSFDQNSLKLKSKRVREITPKILYWFTLKSWVTSSPHLL